MRARQEERDKCQRACQLERNLPKFRLQNRGEIGGTIAKSRVRILSCETENLQGPARRRPSGPFREVYP
jgi:hypothetical protein